MILKIVYKKKFLKLVLMFVLFCHMIFPASGNNVRLNGTVKVTDVTSGVATLELDLSWDNSWRDEFNWDAVWIFVKYRSASGNWSHVLLQETGHSASNGYQLMTGKSGSGVVGIFVYPGTAGVVKRASTKLTLKWPCGSGFTKSSFDNNEVFLLGQGIEMVYVPYGAYYAGDGYSGNCLSDAEGAPLVIDSEDTRTFYQRGSDNSVTTVINNLSANYPKGYSGYYVMKYELSQEQYVRFLNTLTKSEQESLLGVSFLSGLTPGRFIFGDTLQPSFRNGIVLRSKPEGRSYVFGHDLNHNGVYDENGDGQCIACNYLSLNDLLGYASWCGLRPMSELEYERSCRSSFPQVPEKGEYVWNTSGDVSSVPSLLSSGKETEVAGVASNVNSHNSLGSRHGPVRCGAFAGESTIQVESGGTYWGVMEMGGNVGELVANLRNTALNKAVNGNGLFTLTSWSTSPSHYGVRGGSFAGADSLLRSSDRSQAEDYIISVNRRDSTVGMRLTCSPAPELIDPGEIEVVTACPGLITIKNKKSAIATSNVIYLWYIKRPGSSFYELIRGETEAGLKEFDLEISGTSASVTCSFRRKAVALTGESFVDLTLTVPNMNWTLSQTGPITLTSCGATFDNLGHAFVGLKGTPAYSSGRSFQWYFNDKLLSEEAIYYPVCSDYDNTGGRYILEGKMIFGNCEDKKNLTVLVEDIPSQSFTSCGSKLTDCSGNQYSTLQIGSQCWMIENMNAGEEMKKTGATHGIAGVQKLCHQFTSSYCDLYGGLYTWNEAVNGGKPDSYKYVSGNSGAIQGICPDGWHIPASSDWNILINYLGGSSVAGKKMKSSVLWNGEDAVGFNALPSGGLMSDGVSWYSMKHWGVGTGAWFWEADNIGYAKLLVTENDKFENDNFAIPSIGATAVRCIMN